MVNEAAAMTRNASEDPKPDPVVRWLRIVLSVVAAGALVYLLLHRRPAMNALLERFPRVGAVGMESRELRPAQGAEPARQIISYTSDQPGDAVRRAADDYLQTLGFRPVLPPAHAGVWRYARGRQIVTLTLASDTDRTYVAATLSHPEGP
jgi:hypothetical protein